MTGKEAHDHLMKVQAEGGAEGWVEGQERKLSKARVWSELMRAVDEVKRTDKIPADLVKRIREVYPLPPTTPVAVEG